MMISNSSLVLFVFFVVVLLAPTLGQDDSACLPTDFVGTCSANQGCYKGFDFLSAEVTNSASSTNKGFKCGTTDDASELLTNLFVPGQQLVNCAPTNCTFTIQIVDYPNLVRCEQGACVQAGQAMSCETLVCDCDNDPGCASASVLVRALASGATGPSVFNCTTTPDDTSAYHECVLEIPDFLVQRTPLNCTTGQCVDSDVLQQLGIDGGSAVLSNETLVTALDFSGAPVNSTLNACIAAIPTIVAVLLSVWIIAYFLVFLVGLYSHNPVLVEVLEGSNSGLTFSAAGSNDRLEFCVSATIRLSSYALQRRLGGVRGRNRLSFPGKARAGDVEIGSLEAQRTVAAMHTKPGRPNQWYILDSCEGSALSGTVTGILGPSGCGKTTLLSAMSGAAHASLKLLHVTGKITWNGKTVHQGVSSSVAFVPQMDALIPTMTVREQLLFAGRLKNPNIDAEAVRAKAQKILEELGIDNIADQYVGGTSITRGISGGERRRVMIGTALVSDPRMIVLDEPLSGLDSYNALIVTQTLKSLADKGRVVLYSLHQPSNDIYMSLDEAIFMAHGRIVYRGPPGDCGKALHAAGIDAGDAKANALADTMLYALNDPVACDKLLECVSGGASGGAKGDAEPSLGAGSIEDADGTDGTDCNNHTIGGASIGPSSSFKTVTMPSIPMQLGAVFHRTLTDVWRNKSLLLLHVCIAIAAGLLMGGLFYDLGYDTQGVQGRYGGIFVSLCFLAFTSLTTIDLLMAERDVVTAEVNTGLYYGWVYVMVKLLVDGLLLRALPAALYGLPFYWMAGFRDTASSWFSFLFTLILFSLCIGALAVLVVICSRTAGMASFVMNVLLLVQLAFTGFLVNVNSISPVLRWIHWLSQFFYAFEAMIQNELNGGRYELVLTAPGINPVNLPNTAGEVFIDTLGYDTTTSTRNISILIAYYYGFCLLAALAFLFRSRLELAGEHFAWVSSKRGVCLAFGDDKNLLSKVGVLARVVEVAISSSSDGPPHGYCVLKTMRRVSLGDVSPETDAVPLRPFRADLGNPAAVRRLAKRLKEMLESSGNAALKQVMRNVEVTAQPGDFADVIASPLFADADQDAKLVLLETSIEKRLEMVISALEKRFVATSASPSPSLSTSPHKVSSSRSASADKFLAMLHERGASEETVKAVKEEIRKLASMNETHPFYSGQISYLDIVCSVPWNVIRTKRELSLGEVRHVLDSKHHGLADVKKRIVEYVAVTKMVRLQSTAPKMSPPPILLLVGPPGTGKTSIARSIAACLDKKFERVSLGGVRDEAEIRGHRRTYIGAFPGKIVNALRQTAVSDPLILIDEIDKVSRDSGRGDVSSALLELLDPEQNTTFKDHYLNLPLDVSRVTWICTANTLDTVPAPLIDRCEVVELTSYTVTEKRVIAREHLLPEVLKQCGLDGVNLRLNDETLDAMIHTYTREAGVRGLRQILDAVCRHVVVSRLEMAEAENRSPAPSSVVVALDDLHAILGPPKYSSPDHDLLARVPVQGTAIGLVWTPAGGRVQVIECISVPEEGETPSNAGLVLTGSAGDVLNESATIARSWLRANLDRLRMHVGSEDTREHSVIPNAALAFTSTIHVHLPAGAVKKDGPSAGVTILSAMFSLLSGKVIKESTAMTGELTLRGHVLPVGGIKEKLIAAHTTGIRNVIIPKRNLLEAEKCVNDEALSLRLVPCSFADEVLAEAFGFHDVDHTSWLSKM